MEFAINYSTQAATLLADGRIQLDRFKTPDWPDMIAEARRLCPVAVHFTLKAGRGTPKKINWGKITRLLNDTNTPFVNLHLDPKIKDFPDIPVDTTQPAHYQQVVERMIADVQLAVSYFGGDRVIVENVPYRGLAGKTLRPAVEIPAIWSIVNETGCGLLLDISHARIAAHHLGMDEKDYMSQLPIDRLRELHFTGLHNIDGRLQDHLEVLETDWPILDWVLNRIRSGEWSEPWLLAFEYGGVGEKFDGRSDPQVIARQVPQLYNRTK